jgi:hypothetical protein
MSANITMSNKLFVHISYTTSQTDDHVSTLPVAVLWKLGTFTPSSYFYPSLKTTSQAALVFLVHNYYKAKTCHSFPLLLSEAALSSPRAATDHIAVTQCKVRKLFGWVLRAFKDRKWHTRGGERKVSDFKELCHPESFVKDFSSKNFHLLNTVTGNVNLCSTR